MKGLLHEKFKQQTFLCKSILRRETLYKQVIEVTGK